MKVSKLMNKDIYTIDPDKTLQEIEDIMAKKRLTHVVVMEDNDLLGVVSDRDIKRYRSVLAGTSASKASDEATLKFKAHHIMTRDVIVVKEDSEMVDAVSLFLDKRIHFLPVVTESGAIIGSISPTDLLKFAMRVLDMFK